MSSLIFSLFGSILHNIIKIKTHIFIVIIISIILCKLPPNKLHTSNKFHEIPEDGQEIKPKYVRAIINK
jgi:hypothetical protein